MGGWYLFGFIIDLYYWVDFVMCFHTAYWEKIDDGDGVGVRLTYEDRHYLRTWFLSDLLAILPVEYIKRNAQNIAVCSWHLVKDPCGDHVVKGVDHHVMRRIHGDSAVPTPEAGPPSRCSGSSSATSTSSS